jgi:hypothetical protein
MKTIYEESENFGLAGAPHKEADALYTEGPLSGEDMPLDEYPEMVSEDIDGLTFTHSARIQFNDVSDEQYRTYFYASGHEATYDEPLRLNVSASGGHRLLTADGMCHYVKPNWESISWMPKPGRPHFAF